MAGLNDQVFADKGGGDKGGGAQPSPAVAGGGGPQAPQQGGIAGKSDSSDPSQLLGLSGQYIKR